MSDTPSAEPETSFAEPETSFAEPVTPSAELGASSAETKLEGSWLSQLSSMYESCKTFFQAQIEKLKNIDLKTLDAETFLSICPAIFAAVAVILIFIVIFYIISRTQKSTHTRTHADYSKSRFATAFYGLFILGYLGLWAGLIYNGLDYSLLGANFLKSFQALGFSLLPGLILLTSFLLAEPGKLFSSRPLPYMLFITGFFGYLWYNLYSDVAITGLTWILLATCSCIYLILGSALLDYKEYVANIKRTLSKNKGYLLLILLSYLSVFGVVSMFFYALFLSTVGFQTIILGCLSVWTLNLVKNVFNFLIFRTLYLSETTKGLKERARNTFTLNAVLHLFKTSAFIDLEFINRGIDGLSHIVSYVPLLSYALNFLLTVVLLPVRIISFFAPENTKLIPFLAVYKNASAFNASSKIENITEGKSSKPNLYSFVALFFSTLLGAAYIFGTSDNMQKLYEMKYGEMVFDTEFLGDKLFLIGLVIIGITAFLNIFSGFEYFYQYTYAARNSLVDKEDGVIRTLVADELIL